MATSGKLQTNIVMGDCRVAFYWNVIEQSVNDNTSTISWKLVLECDPVTPGAIHRAGAIDLRFDSETVFSRASYTEHETGDIIASGTKVVTHNTNGSKTFKVKLDMQLGSYSGTESVFFTGNVILNDIPRASRVTVNSGVIGTNTIITISKAQSHYTHTLSYAFGDFNEDIVEKTDETTITWTIPMSFYNQIPNRTYGTGEIYCYTYDGNTLIGVSFASFRASAGDVKPIVELSVVENDATVKSVTGGSYLLQYTSDAKYTIDATALYGATIESYSITNGSTTYTTPTGVFEDVVDEYYTVIVTDSRGLSTTLETRKVTNKYVKVTCNLSLQNLDTEDGSVTMSVNGNYFNRDFYSSTKPNQLTLSIDCFDSEGTKVVTKTLTPSLYENTYSVSVKFEDLDYKEGYKMVAYAADLITSATSAEVPVAFVPVFDWSKTDFKFNVPITKIGEYNFADFVIEYGETAMGTNGKWYWRKWASGRAECTGSRNFGAYNIGKNATGMLRGTVLSQDFPAGLFVDEPHYINMKFKHSQSSASEGKWGAIVTYVGTDQALGETITYPSATNTGTFALCLPTNALGTTVTLPATHICFEVVGRWK